MDDNHLYCQRQLRESSRYAYLRALFIAEPVRAEVMGLLALSAELSRIPGLVSEEMIGHIRFAWWREAVEELTQGGEVRPHPVLQALAPLVDKGRVAPQALENMVNAHAEAYPVNHIPEEVDEVVVNAYLERHAPQAIIGWKRAGEMIAHHRAKYGNRRYAWLVVKLLVG